MCGIAGIVGRVNDAHRGALDRMMAAIAHRGPDGSGSWVSSVDAEGFGCLLGHRRLAILDLSHAGDQPMVDTSHGRSLVTVFNGEIYNFKDLRADLERAGETFTSSGDTAVMLRLLSLRGPDAVRALRGMFAFALWDDQRRQLVLARDPLGIKPLYVSHNRDARGDWSLIFASEVRALVASGLLGRPRLDRRAVESMLWNGFVVGPNTAIQGVDCLGAGEIWTYEAPHPPVRRRYWTIPPPGHDSPIGVAEFRDVVRDSVARHLIADVPVGIFLSGGIDSSAVAALAQRASGTAVHTFTLAFEERELNEGEFARAVARAIGSDHHEITLREADFAAALDTAVDTLDQPTFDGLNSYYVSKAVRDAGLTVALVGTGGDELFGGYSTFRHLPALHRWLHRGRVVPAPMRVAAARLATRVLAKSGGSVPAQTRWAKLPDIARNGHDLTTIYQLSYSLFLQDFQQRLLGGSASDGLVAGLPRAFATELASELEGRSDVSTVAALEQRIFLGERLLRDTDAASMAVSLEARLPLVDHVVVEAANRLPDEPRFQPLGRKQILRTVGLDTLDPSLFERPKRGFVLPFEAWTRKSLGRAMDETMRDHSLARDVGLDGAVVEQLWNAYQQRQPGLHWSRVWAVYVLTRWCHRHGVLA